MGIFDKYSLRGKKKVAQSREKVTNLSEFANKLANTIDHVEVPFNAILLDNKSGVERQKLLSDSADSAAKVIINTMTDDEILKLAVNNDVRQIEVSKKTGEDSEDLGQRGLSQICSSVRFINGIFMNISANRIGQMIMSDRDNNLVSLNYRIIAWWGKGEMRNKSTKMFQVDENTLAGSKEMAFINTSINAISSDMFVCFEYYRKIINQTKRYVSYNLYDSVVNAESNKNNTEKYKQIHLSNILHYLVKSIFYNDNKVSGIKDTSKPASILNDHAPFHQLSDHHLDLSVYASLCANTNSLQYTGMFAGQLVKELEKKRVRRIKENGLDILKKRENEFTESAKAPVFEEDYEDLDKIVEVISILGTILSVNLSLDSIDMLEQIQKLYKSGEETSSDVSDMLELMGYHNNSEIVHEGDDEDADDDDDTEDDDDNNDAATEDVEYRSLREIKDIQDLFSGFKREELKNGLISIYNDLDGIIGTREKDLHDLLKIEKDDLVKLNVQSKILADKCKAEMENYSGEEKKTIINDIMNQK
jgi:hypothetical protein